MKIYYFFITISILQLLNTRTFSQNVQEDTLHFRASVNEILDYNEDFLKTKVTTASRSDENINQAPGIITVLDEKNLQAYAGQDLVEILNRVTSIYLMGSYSNPQNIISVRGELPTQNNNHVLILLNGRPVREPYWGGFDFPVILGFPVEALKKIEIIRGPGSVLYGTNAFTGIVNLITNHSNPSTKISAGMGSFENVSFSAVTGKAEGRLYVSGAFKYFHEKGWRLQALGEAQDSIDTYMGENNLGVNFNLSYGGLSINSFMAYSGQGIIGHAPTTQLPVNVRNRENEGLRSFFDIGYEHQFSNFLTSSLNLNYNSLNQRTWLPPGQFDGFTQGALIEQINHLNVLENLNLLFGGSYYYIKGRGEIGDNPDLGAPPFTDDLYNSFLQVNWSPLSWLKLIAGGQLNKVDNIQPDIVPRFGIMPMFSDKFGAKLLYGEAFRAGFPAEKRFQDPPRAIGNPQLKPEKIRTLDLQFYYLNQRNYAAITFFNSNLSDLIIRAPVVLNDGETVLQYINYEESNIQGFELEAETEIIPGLDLEASFTTQSSITNDSLKNANFIPNMMVKGGISYRQKAFSLGFYNTYYDAVKDVSILNQERLKLNPEAAAYLWSTLKLSSEINNFMKISSNPIINIDLEIINLFNQKVYFPEVVRKNINTIPGKSGRAIYLALNLVF